MLTGILMIVGGGVLYSQATKIEAEMAAEEDKRVKKALAKSAETRKAIAYIFFAIGIGSLIIILTLLSDLEF